VFTTSGTYPWSFVIFRSSLMLRWLLVTDPSPLEMKISYDEKSIILNKLFIRTNPLEYIKYQGDPDYIEVWL